MKRFSIVIGLVLLWADPAFAQAPRPVCTAQALAAKVALPPLTLTCNDSGSQVCSSDTPSTLLDDPSCTSAVGLYGKTLSRSLTARWWSAPAGAIEACRVHGKPGAVTSDESDALDTGYGPLVQGTDRIRLLVLGDVCGAPGISNVLLAVRGDRGLAVTPLFLAFNQGGQESPFGLDVATSGSDTYALFSTSGHDMNDAYTTTSVYRIDFATGAATPYALYRDGAGDTSVFETSEPIGADLDESRSGQISGGHFVAHFVNYEANACAGSDDKCPPVTRTAYSWNGSQFVIDGYDAAHKVYQRKLAAQRACLARNFDAKKGVSTCDTELACEAKNDLSLLSYKAHLFDRAEQYAADALEYCRGRAGDMAAAVFNYRRAKTGR